ncbi:MAG: inorganic phosphate transporter [Muribaculum sp.]
MDILFLCLIIFLFLLAVFDLSVGVSNDAVNFLNSAMGSKAAPLKHIIIIASIGIFIGAAMSNGMMDIARHGIFRPEHFSFYDLLCIFMAVIVTDIILLDMFNTLGMPTSTTVSMVFELLGATFVVALLKMAGDTTGLSLSDLLNTEKALSVILGIFLSVAIAFVFGTIVQFISRMIFSFNYRKGLKWKIGIFGGVASTALIYFMLIKGIKDLSFMTPELKSWINDNTLLILGSCMVFFTLLMQLLHACKVNVLKVVVLMGTFSLAMAFAGNDLVNFIGVPLSGLSSYQDYIANGAGAPKEFMMGSLNLPANTPVYFLIGAGLIMVVSLATSKKARNVSKTEIGLSSRGTGEEMFGSSRIARRLVKWSLTTINWVKRITPVKVRAWLNRRFDSTESVTEQGAAFDLVRASVNLMLAGMLIALGTSLKLPLSTTFVTFMVAMGTSLSDRAWSRESAVFRITGVISVIGGWFITAGAAFIGAGILVFLMHLGGHWAMIALAAAAVAILIRSNRRFRKKKAEEKEDILFQTILNTPDNTDVWDLFKTYVVDRQKQFMIYASESYQAVTEAFIKENSGVLSRYDRNLEKEKDVLKSARRKETLCLRKLSKEKALEKNAWFHLSNNCCMSMLYNLRRITEMCKEHVENNFLPLPSQYKADYESIAAQTVELFNDTISTLEISDTDMVPALRSRCDEIKDRIAEIYHRLYDHLHDGDTSSMTVMYVYLNMLQETQELVAGLRKYLRAYAKLLNTGYRTKRRRVQNA